MNRDLYTTDNEYFLFPISDVDRENYTELHRQLNGDKSLLINPRSKDLLWEQMLYGKTKIFSIYDKDGYYCGSIELQNPSSVTPEIGINLMEEKRNKGIAARVVKLLAKTFYEQQDVEWFLIRISSRNLHSRHVFEKMGAILLGEEAGVLKSFMKTLTTHFRGTVDDSEINELKERMKAYFNEDEDEIVYRYKLSPEVFGKA